MKEYQSKTGGRYIFNEDIHYLQDLALSMTEIFKDSGLDFVISGCKITITGNYSVKIDPGYVFLDGKVRYVSGINVNVGNIASIGIYAKNSDGPSVVYADGSTHRQYTEYSAVIKVNDNNADGAASIMAVGAGSAWKFPDLRYAWFRHYAITKDEGGVVDVIKMLANGGQISGASGNTDDFRHSYINSQTGVPADTVINGVSINDIPMFTYNDLLLVNKMLLQNLFVKNTAYINELYVNNAHIPNTVRVLKSAKMLANDGTTTISTLVAYVTNFELIISGSCNAEHFGNDMWLYLPDSIKTIVNSRSPIIGTTHNSTESDTVLYANETFKGIAYTNNSGNNGALSWTALTNCDVKIKASGGVMFSVASASNLLNKPKMCVHFNLLYSGE